jgi:hypothetical protein
MAGCSADAPPSETATISSIDAFSGQITFGLNDGRSLSFDLSETPFDAASGEEGFILVPGSNVNVRLQPDGRVGSVEVLVREADATVRAVDVSAGTVVLVDEDGSEITLRVAAGTRILSADDQSVDLSVLQPDDEVEARYHALTLEAVKLQVEVERPDGFITTDGRDVYLIKGTVAAIADGGAIVVQPPWGEAVSVQVGPGTAYEMHRPDAFAGLRIGMPVEVLLDLATGEALEFEIEDDTLLAGPVPTPALAEGEGVLGHRAAVLLVRDRAGLSPQEAEFQSDLANSYTDVLLLTYMEATVGEVAALQSDVLPAVFALDYVEGVDASRLIEFYERGGRVNLLGSASRYIDDLAIEGEVLELDPSAIASATTGFAGLAAPLRQASNTPGKLYYKPGRAGVITVFPNIASYDEFVERMRAVADVYRKEQDSGFLAITSAPAGARVFVNGLYVGETQPEGLGLQVKPGVHSVSLRMGGFADYDTVAEVAAASEKGLHVDLRELDPTHARFPLPPSTLTAGKKGFTASDIVRDELGDLYLTYEYLAHEYGEPNEVRPVYYYLTGVAVGVSTDDGRTWTHLGQQQEFLFSEERNFGDGFSISDEAGSSYEGVAAAPGGGIYIYYSICRLRARHENVAANSTGSCGFGEEAETPLVQQGGLKAMHVTASGVAGHWTVSDDWDARLRFHGVVGDRQVFWRRDSRLYLSNDGGQTLSGPFELLESGEARYVPFLIANAQDELFGILGDGLYRLEGTAFRRIDGVSVAGSISLLDGHNNGSAAFDEQGNLHLALREENARIVYQFVPAWMLKDGPKPYEQVWLATLRGPAHPVLTRFLSEGGVPYATLDRLDAGDGLPEDIEAVVEEQVSRFHDSVVVVRKAAGEFALLHGFDRIALARALGIPYGPAIVSPGPQDVPLGTFFTESGGPDIIASVPQGVALFSYNGEGWDREMLFEAPQTPYYDFRVGPGIRSADDVEFLAQTSHRLEETQFWGPVLPFRTYDLYTTRVKEDAFGEVSFGERLAPPSDQPPVEAVIAHGQPFTFVGMVGDRAAIIIFSSDKRAFIVSKEEHCAGRGNCLAFDPETGALHVKLSGGTTAHVDDQLSALADVSVAPIEDGSKLFLAAATREGPPVVRKATLTFSKDGVSYEGDITALRAELDLSGTDYEQKKAKYHGLLSQKAYLVLENKNLVYGNGGKHPPYMTEFELLYMLEEAEKVAAQVYGPFQAGGIQFSKSLWVKSYYYKDQGALNPFTSILVGGDPAGAPQLELPLANDYVPGWFVDRDGDLINFAHIYAVIALQDLPEPEIVNAWRSLAYSYAGDRGFTYFHYMAYLACKALCQDLSETAWRNALNEAPADEVIADFYSLQLRDRFRNNPVNTRLSRELAAYFGSADQRQAKSWALAEMSVFGTTPSGR